MNATDDLYQVIYECSVCSEIRGLDDISLARIAQRFKQLGWENEPVRVSDEKTNYVVTCPDCVAAEFHAERDYHDWCEVQDSQEMERMQGRW